MPLVTVPVRATYLDESGDPAAGTVTFYSHAPFVHSDDDIVLLGTVVATLDADGHIEVPLVATDSGDMSPTGWSWGVIESVDGQRRAFSMSVPASAEGTGIELADVAPVAPADGEVSYVTLAAHSALAARVEAVEETDPVPGPAGPQGPAGDDSTVPGPQGPTGPAGSDSTVPGPQGPAGPAGADSTVPGPSGTDGADGMLAPGDRIAAEATSTLGLMYLAGTSDPEIFRVVYAPEGGIAEGLPQDQASTFVLNEIGLVRVQCSPDNPTDVPVKIFGRQDTKQFDVDAIRVIEDRTQQGASLIFAVGPDGRVDLGLYPWTELDYATGSNPTRYTVPGGATYYPAAVRREGSDLIRLRGSVNVSDGVIVAGDTIATLPAEFRPSKTVRVLASTADSALGSRIEIAPSGAMTIRPARASGAGYVALDGITYTL